MLFAKQIACFRHDLMRFDTGFLGGQRGMNARFITAIAACALFLSGCAGHEKPTAQTITYDPVMRFKGTLTCSDCTAIGADLSLYQDIQTGEPKGYVLNETHVDAPGGNFTSTSWGEWSKDLQPQPPVYRLVVKSPSARTTERAFELKDDALSPLEEHDSKHAHELRRIVPLAPVK